MPVKRKSLAAVEVSVSELYQHSASLDLLRNFRFVDRGRSLVKYVGRRIWDKSCVPWWRWLNFWRPWGATHDCKREELVVFGDP